MQNRLELTLCIGLLLAGNAALGQATAAPAPASSSNLTFDVASVRPSAPLDPAKLAADMQAGRMPRFGAHIDASRAEYNYMTLKDLIASAYDVKPYQVNGPDWLNAQRFDIAATLPEGASKDDAPKMLQALLADRFKLVAHRQTEQHSVLALVVGKGGPKLQASPAPAAPIDPDAPLQKGEMKMDGPDGPVRITTHPDGSFTENMGAKGKVTGKMDPATMTMHMDADTMTMDGFADMLTSMMQMGGGSQQVVNMTGLKGNYQVSIDISLASLVAAARAQGMNVPGPGAGSAAAGPLSAEAPDPGGGTGVNKSVEALGLRLESRKAPVEQVIVDHAEKTPTEN